MQCVCRRLNLYAAREFRTFRLSNSCFACTINCVYTLQFNLASLWRHLILDSTLWSPIGQFWTWTIAEREILNLHAKKKAFGWNSKDKILPVRCQTNSLLKSEGKKKWIFWSKYQSREWRARAYLHCDSVGREWSRAWLGSVWWPAEKGSSTGHHISLGLV